jgi:hypothetical protein
VENVCDVTLDGVDRENQFLGDLAVRATLRKQTRDPQLLPGQLVVMSSAATARSSASLNSDSTTAADTGGEPR